MGDRGNIIVKDGESTVYLYTHWRGSDLPEIAKEALRRGRDRWMDGRYLARILFSEMTAGSPQNETTGFGISSVMGDGGTEVTINIADQSIQIKDGKAIQINTFVGL